MEPFISKILLSIGWFILAISISVLVLKARFSAILKMVLITVVVWYGLVMWCVPSNFLGWPSDAELPDEMIVLDYHLAFPKDGGEPKMIFWGLEREHIDVEELKITITKLATQPDILSFIKMNGVPRAYIMEPKSKEERERLTKKFQEKEEEGVMVYRKKKDKHKGDWLGKLLNKQKGGMDQDEWMIINPDELMSKGEIE